MRVFDYIFLAFLICSCGKRDSPQNDNIEIEPKQLNENINNDSHFVLRDVKNLNFIDSLYWDFENLYVNKLKKQKFVKLTNDQKLLLLSSFLKSHNRKNIDFEWIKNDIQAFIVAKQPKIKNFQPTIIKVYGTDFAAVILVNLYHENKVISGLPIYNIENSGPEIAEDSIIITRPKVNCTFERNRIQHFKLTGTCYPQSDDPYLFTIDSITSMVTIENSGVIELKKIDSTRYQKQSKLEYFQSY